MKVLEDLNSIAEDISRFKNRYPALIGLIGILYGAAYVAVHKMDELGGGIIAGLAVIGLGYLVLHVTLLGYFYLARRRTRITIAVPTADAKVPFSAEVSGFIKPPNRPVRLFVYSGDGRWHPQPAVMAKDGKWSARCWFGREDTPSNSAFQIVAIDGAFAPSEPSLDLPTTTRSEPITVFRE